MPSFQLKPMGYTNRQAPNMYYLPKIEDVIWTANRSLVPTQFANKIPEDVWARTFDAVQSRHAADLDLIRESLAGLTCGLPIFPCIILRRLCCAPCIICNKFARMGELQASKMELREVKVGACARSKSGYALTQRTWGWRLRV